MIKDVLLLPARSQWRRSDAACFGVNGRSFAIFGMTPRK
jgi:hypothetical protein